MIRVLGPLEVDARGPLAAANRGTLAVRLPKLRKAKHKLTVKYLGSSTVRPSASPVKTVTLR